MIYDFGKPLPFESSVISYGNQTKKKSIIVDDMFESSVISYGNQTHGVLESTSILFESSVISYGNLVFEDKNHLNLVIQL